MVNIMNKKGFTIIEIIVCISILTIISTITITVSFLNGKQDEIKKATNNILNAAEIYVNVSKDENGINYIKQIENGKGGVKIPINELVSNGYVKKEDANIIYNKYKNTKKLKDDEDYYILLADGSYNKTDYYFCENNEYMLEASWFIDSNKTLYLCNNKSSYNEETNTIFDKVISSNGNIEVLNSPIELENYNIALKSQISGSYAISYTSKQNGLFQSNILGEENSFWYFRGNVTNNYVKINDDIYRILNFIKEESGNIYFRLISENEILVSPFENFIGDGYQSYRERSIEKFCSIVSEKYNDYDKDDNCKLVFPTFADSTTMDPSINLPDINYNICSISNKLLSVNTILSSDGSSYENKCNDFNNNLITVGESYYSGVPAIFYPSISSRYGGTNGGSLITSNSFLSSGGNTMTANLFDTGIYSNNYVSLSNDLYKEFFDDGTPVYSMLGIFTLLSYNEGKKNTETYVRPVITINGNSKVIGSGTIGFPYEFVDLM